VTSQRRVSASRAGHVLTGLWTVVAFSIALTALTNGSAVTVLWWAVFPLGWIVARHSRLSEDHRLAVILGATVVGSALVTAGAWMAWPRFGPLSDGMRLLIPLEHIERGFQLFDVPLVATAILGSLGVLRYQRERRAATIALVAGISALLVTTSIAWVVGSGFWVFSWGFYVTLGGSVCLVYAGLFGLSFGDQRSEIATDSPTT
jgi:hypothetical protein